MHRQQTLVLLYIVLEVIKTTLRCDHLLEGLTEMWLYSQLWFNYSKRIQIKVSKGKRCTGWSLGTLEQLQASSFTPTGVTDRQHRQRVVSQKNSPMSWYPGLSVTQASRACVTERSYLVCSASTSPNRRSN